MQAIVCQLCVEALYNVLRGVVARACALATARVGAAIVSSRLLGQCADVHLINSSARHRA
jgi:hypothetical protein